MTAHGPSGQRRVIIVDDAQLVHTEVLAYLRLLISFGIEPVPQFLFVGDPSFSHRAAEAAHANVRDLITDWVDLEPLTSAESREFAELLLGSAGPAAGAALDQAALDELVRASDGLIGRLVSLLAGAAAPPDDVPRELVADPRLDDATAVASGETDNVSQSKHDAGRLPEDAVPAQDRPDPEVAAALFGAPSLRTWIREVASGAGLRQPGGRAHARGTGRCGRLLADFGSLRPCRPGRARDDHRSVERWRSFGSAGHGGQCAIGAEF